MTYLRFEAADLPSNTGRVTDDGARLNQGQPGHVAYGPYFKAEAGIYVAGFYLRRTTAPADSNLHMDALAEDGQPLATRVIDHAELFDNIARLVHVEFELPAPAAALQVRLYAEEGAAVEVQSLVVFSTRPRSWGGN